MVFTVIKCIAVYRLKLCHFKDVEYSSLTHITEATSSQPSYFPKMSPGHLHYLIAQTSPSNFVIWGFGVHPLSTN